MIPQPVQAGQPVSAAAHNALLAEVLALRDEVARLRARAAAADALPRILPCRVAAVHGAAPGAEARAGSVTYDLLPVGRSGDALIENAAPDIGRPCDPDTTVTAARIGQVGLVVRAPRLDDQGRPDGFESCVLLGEVLRFAPCP